MKKLFVFIFFISAFLSFVPSSFAATTTLCAAQGPFAVLCNPSIDKLIVGLINLVFVISTIAALLYLIWGGFKWLTSGGDKSAVQGAREHIVAAIVGLVIIFMSYFVLNFIIGFFIPNFSLNNFKIPSITSPNGGSGPAGGDSSKREMGESCSRNNQCFTNICRNGQCR